MIYHKCAVFHRTLIKLISTDSLNFHFFFGICDLLFVIFSLQRKLSKVPGHFFHLLDGFQFFAFADDVRLS